MAQEGEDTATVERSAGRRAAGPKVTLVDLAAHAGVSRSTVSLVLRDSPLVKAETRERVRSAIETLGYVYDRSAARLRGCATQTVGLVVTDLTNSFYAEFIAGVDAALNAAGSIAFLANTGEDLDRQGRVLERFREHAVDGVILCPAEGAPPDLVTRMRAWGLPCVQALRRIEGVDADFAGTDNRRGTDLATEHLISRGHRAIAFVGAAADTSVARDRRGGYEDAMRRHGLAPAVQACRSTKEDAAAAIRAALAGPTPPTAVACFNDPVAMGVTLGIRQAGRVPGEEIAVIGFDDTADAALWVPGLSSVAIQPAGIGAAAADLLLRRIADPEGRPERVVIEPRLMVRESTRRTLNEGAAR